MQRINEFHQRELPAKRPLPVWRKALRSVFGAAERLHRYRDARDVMLQHVIHEHERELRQQPCCGEG